MKTYVLVPGFWLGGWAWQEVSDRLQAAGHETFPVTLTGLGERAGQASPDVGLEAHVTDIEGLIEERDLRDVILVAHSGGGVPVTVVVDRMSERIARVVYVDSGPMSEGSAQADFNSPEQRAALDKQIQEEGEGWKIPPPSFDPADDPILFAGLEDAAPMVRARATPQPVRTSTDQVHLTGKGTSVPMTIITSTIPPGALRKMLGPVGDIRELPTGHWPMFSRPADLADMLLALA